MNNSAHVGVVRWQPYHKSYFEQRSQRCWGSLNSIGKLQASLVTPEARKLHYLFSSSLFVISDNVRLIIIKFNLVNNVFCLLYSVPFIKETVLV